MRAGDLDIDKKVLLLPPRDGGNDARPGLCRELSLDHVLSKSWLHKWGGDLRTGSRIRRIMPHLCTSNDSAGRLARGRPHKRRSGDWSGSAVLEGLFHGVRRVVDNPEGYCAYLECRPHWCSAEAAATQSRKSEYTGTPLASIMFVTFWVYGPPFPPTKMGFLAAAENSAR